MVAAGHTPTAIHTTLGCARSTVYATIRAARIEAQPDRRGKNNGAPVRLCRDEIDSILRHAREDRPYEGPRMLHARMVRSPGASGLPAEGVPSPSSLAHRVRAMGLAQKPIGPGDNRAYPATAPDSPGLVTIDTWGPWHIRGQSLYLVTRQDRSTRFFTAYPTNALIEFPTAADGKPGPVASVWARGLQLAATALGPLPHGLPRPRWWSRAGTGIADAGGPPGAEGRRAGRLPPACAALADRPAGARPLDQGARGLRGPAAGDDGRGAAEPR